MYNSYACRTGLFVALALLSACIVGSLGHEALRLAHDAMIALYLLSCSVRSISLCLDSLRVVGSSVGDLLSVRVCLGLFRWLRVLRVLRLARLTSIILLSCLGLDIVLELGAVDVGVLAEAVLHVPTQSR
jgi:hypothetical protein